MIFIYKQNVCFVDFLYDYTPRFDYPLHSTLCFNKEKALVFGQKLTFEYSKINVQIYRALVSRHEFPV